MVIPRHSRPLDQFHWTHDGAEVKTRGHRLVFGSSLQIHGVTDADRGTWTCCFSSRDALENHVTYDLEITGNGRSCKNLFKILFTVFLIAFIIAVVPLALIYRNHHQLQAKHSQLEHSYNSLQADDNQFGKGRSSLQTNYSQLEHRYNSLRANYSRLEHDYSRQNKSCGQLLVRTRELLNTLIDDGINSTCPWGWSKINKTCYYFSKESSDWHGANHSCVANNSTLATVTTESQQDLLANYDSEKRWIGLTDLDQVGVYVWVNGEQLGKGFWDFGEPNNQGKERCVTKGARYHLHKWNNDVCSARHHWICQTSSFECLARRFGLEALLRQ
ncbi:uncharacterized protein LOC144487463 [Mustelus asterias]